MKKVKEDYEHLEARSNVLISTLGFILLLICFVGSISCINTAINEKNAGAFSNKVVKLDMNNQVIPNTITTNGPNYEGTIIALGIIAGIIAVAGIWVFIELINWLTKYNKIKNKEEGRMNRK